MIESLRDGNITVGVKQTIKTIEKGAAKVVFIARDADERVVGKVIELCKKDNVQVVYVDTMKLLGKACNIDVGAAVACTLK
ncbi:ribosomal L7Ae/L30e/S12e/Gadd45 family protein [Acetivibrio cellulolyticus]|uniref:ribosomal L7Ae/L30e/S12e/Gadd45 family protein n=1 Tax=Acetivibrio cellulolyticus TaxID=35830 RepID=UPI0001E2FB0A|nr:ribosomal L7Ae/L30e/S12e/Gadd45 family protein [Acetivibrio cellulolyticus]